MIPNDLRERRAAGGWRTVNTRFKSQVTQLEWPRASAMTAVSAVALTVRSASWHGWLELGDQAAGWHRCGQLAVPLKLESRPEQR